MSISQTVESRHTQASQHLQSGVHKAAIQLFDSLLEDVPCDPNVLNDAALAHAMDGNIHQAEAYFHKALDVQPEHKSSFYNLIKLYRSLKRPIEAALAFNRFQESIPESSRKSRLESELWPDLDTEPDLFRENHSPNVDTLNNIWSEWGNSGWSANPQFARKMLELANDSDKCILECGSGFTTLVLGYLAAERGNEVWSLEHDARWHKYVTTVLQRTGIDCVNLCHTPLCDYGKYDWYDISDIKLPDNVGLVVCDGPPGGTRGGRSGLFPSVSDRFSTNCSILLDDVNRPSEMNLAVHWSAEGSFSLQVFQSHGKQFAVLDRT